MECEYHDRLSAFHDGEMSQIASAAMERHLETCPRCAAELAQIRELARSFEGFANDPMSMSMLTRAQKTAARFASEHDSPIIRIASLLAALAASILIIASAWLWQGPTPKAEARRIAVGAAPEWERVAVALDIDPAPGAANASPEAIALAEARLTDWMLQNLSR